MSENIKWQEHLLRALLLPGFATSVACSAGSVRGTGSGDGGAAVVGEPNGGSSSGSDTTAASTGSSTGGSSSGAAVGTMTATGSSSGSSGGGSGSSGAGSSSSSGGTGGSGATVGIDAGGGSGAGGAHDAGLRPSGDAGAVANPDAGVPSIPADPSKKITVWLAGDSTMQPCTTACPCGWGSQFQPYFTANATVVNSAAGGRSIQTWLYDPNVQTTMGANGECAISPMTYSARWQAMLDPTNGMKPGDYLFIEFGINDGDPTCNRHVGTALFQTYLGTMAQAAKTRGAQPIFLTSTSYMQCTGATVTANRGFGPETKAAAAANNVPVIDLTQLSAALYTSLGLCPNALDFTSTTSAVGLFFCNDHTHFEAAGAIKVAGVVAQALRDQNIGLAAYLK